MFGNIATTLGIGSGLNSAQLVNDLATAVRAPKESALRSRESLNAARISALSSASGALTNFGTALNDLLSGSNFVGTPRSSNDGAVAVSLLPGGRPSSSAAQVRVLSLAAAQVSQSGIYAGGSSAVGAGDLIINSASGTSASGTSASGAFTINITDPTASLSDVASAINRSAADAGSAIRARIVSDVAGSRLMLSGAEGGANAFSISADSGASAELQALASGISLVRPASNAAVELDGAPLSFASNVVDSAVSGLRLTLKTVTGADAVSVAADIPADGLKSLLSDFVKAYNDLRSGLNSAVAPGSNGASGGPLAGDAGVRTMMAALARMTTQPMSDTGAIRSLSDMGIRTQRDGTLSIDTARLDAALANNADAIRDLINPPVSSALRPGLSGLFDAVRTPLQANAGPLAASKRTYEAAQKQLATLRDRMEADDDRYRVQLERSFTGMEKQLTILKATQSYVTQQIAAWNAQGNR
jgi:flagellar hook-associated protein 2